LSSPVSYKHVFKLQVQQPRTQLKFAGTKSSSGHASSRYYFVPIAREFTCDQAADLRTSKLTAGALTEPATEGNSLFRQKTSHAS